MATPLFIKYQTKSNKPYIYDVATGQIIKASKTAYELIDDYYILNVDELKKKHKRLGLKNVEQAVADIESLRQVGCLVDHEPRIPSRVESVYFQGKTWKLREFLGYNPMHLILCVTNECNLRCEYCIYGRHYPGHRDHGKNKMSSEIMELAIKEFLEHSLDSCSIGFYGGEPLLEFKLIQHYVFFAEQKAKELKKRLSWTVTTNGTLLSLEKVKFLCEHNFLVLISLDGPKSMHDRYRIFKGSTKNGYRIGTFDTIIKHLQNFIRKYPDYQKRGLILILAPPCDFEASEDFFATWGPFFPYSKINFADDTKEQTFIDSVLCDNADKGLNCTSCGSSTCHGLEITNLGFNHNECRVSVGRETERDKIRRLFEKFKSIVTNIGYVNMLKNPEHMFLQRSLSTTITPIHTRLVTDRGASFMLNAPCLPGHFRLFCDVEGNYYPCERVENVELFQLGNVFDGFNVEKAVSLLEKWRNAADCGNCVAQKLCNMCFAICHQKGQDFDAESLRRECLKQISATRLALRWYTEIMERNSKALSGIPDEINIPQPVLGTTFNPPTIEEETQSYMI